MNNVNNTRLFVFLSALSFFLIGCDSVGKDWEDTTSKNTIEAYEAFLLRYPDSEYHDSALKMLESLATEHLRQSFMAVFTAVKAGESILDAAVVDHSSYDKARKLLDEILNSLPERALAANNRAVLAVEEGDFERARSLFEHAVAIAEDNQIDEVALEIGIQSADNTWLSHFYLLQPADMAIKQFSFAKHKYAPEKLSDPLTVTLDLSTPGAAQLRSIKDSPYKHVVVDKAKPTYLLKREIKNNIRALDALVDPSARRRYR